MKSRIHATHKSREILRLVRKGPEDMTSRYAPADHLMLMTGSNHQILHTQNFKMGQRNLKFQGIENVHMHFVPDLR